MPANGEGNRLLPIGVQSFAVLRQNGYLYVDKTDYLYNITHKGRQYFLSRPRRFGKSLFLSTLRAYWEGRQELFADLKIVELTKNEPDAWRPHPIFYFDFNGKNYQVNTALEEVLDEHLCRWEKIYGGDGSLPLSYRFRNLLAAAYEKTGLPVVVLIDEYDKPLLEVLENNDLEEHNKAVFKGFFGTLKSYDDYLRFVFITGVTKFSKVSIFSDLNQLWDISLDEHYNAVCGITETEMKENFTPEIENLAQKNKQSVAECLSALKKMYDGYHFFPHGTGLYNPFSIISAFAAQRINSYWFATGTPTFLTRRVKALKMNAAKFTNGTLYATAAALSDYRADNPDPVPLLYQTGYLTIWDYDARRERYTLGFPNDEVQYGFLSSLLPTYTPAAVSATGTDIFTLDECIEIGDTDGMRDILTALFAGIPYSSDNAPFEHYFEAIIYLVFTLLGKYVQCEVHTAKGRADAIVGTDKFVYIFEFKLNQSAAVALAQIDEKDYAAPYVHDKRTLYKIGVNFSADSRALTEWEVR